MPPAVRGRGQRPERTAPAEAFYNASEVAKYNASSRMAVTQRHLARRALQLLQLPASQRCLLLDLGCGTGLSGDAIERAGHSWIGVDISVNMLRSTRAPTKPRDALAADIGCRLGLRKGVFDGALSISAVQWLCFATRPEDVPQKRVRQFFRGLCAVLMPGARAVLQLYPEKPGHVGMLREAALGCGFSGALVVDYPRSERSKKLFLVLCAPTRSPWPCPRPPLAASTSAVKKGNATTRKGGWFKGKVPRSPAATLHTSAIAKDAHGARQPRRGQVVAGINQGHAVVAEAEVGSAARLPSRHQGRRERRSKQATVRGGL
uniref:Methyltransferase type 11 domain-containing protein n=1 Tax=Calcidiscus leptoporus TaxID=127549 RepID=A0A7S0JB64_9EUKA|mmetsp:Transcript_46795/g.108706  ORF Transcript_46795/g.108706 Transcript_46795/m.108706 type:complete len:319 (+) Transcript_46795:3-959(+)